MNKIINKTLSILLAVVGLSGAIATPVFAEGDCSDICNCSTADPDVQAAAGCSNTTTKIEDSITIILNGVIMTLSIVAVIFIIIGGFQYMTSTGDPSKTKKAKDTITYAAIGLGVCSLAAIIVNFVILKIIK
ncbi:hypothetical protein IKF12_03330 [Candidatus Saccharibacteria bacterium]|nr:hypothetical protein [Candidatus Saccharibacteria bacterium]